jgi:hypothetical protein
MNAEGRTRSLIAQHIARLMADHGLEQGPARRRAIGEIGEGRRMPPGCVPDAHEVDEALREHLTLFDPDHAARVRHMRVVALEMMARLAPTTVLATGAVWKGIATASAPVHLQCFAEEAKGVHFRLLDMGLDPEVLSLRHFRTGTEIEGLGVHWRGEAILISIYDLEDLRGALVAPAGSTAERGDIAALRARLAQQP